MPAADVVVRKDPRKADAGRLGARAKWGPPRIARLDDLTPEQRAVVLALVEAARSAKAAIR